MPKVLLSTGKEIQVALIRYLDATFNGVTVDDE